MIDARRVWLSATLGLALVLGQAGGLAHLLTHLDELGKGAPHPKTCPFDAPYCQLASGLTETASPVPTSVDANDVTPTTPQPTLRSAFTVLPFARAPPSQS